MYLIYLKNIVVDFIVIDGSQVNPTTKIPYKYFTFLTIFLPCFNEYRNIFIQITLKLFLKTLKIY